MNDAPLTDEEVRKSFYSQKSNKSPGYDEVSFNAINKVFDFIVEPLSYIFSNSLVQGIFSEEMKIAQVTSYTKPDIKKMLQIIGQYLFCRVFQKYQKELGITELS